MKYGSKVKKELTSPRWLECFQSDIQAIDLAEVTDPSGTLIRAMYDEAVDSLDFFFQWEAPRLVLRYRGTVRWFLREKETAGQATFLSSKIP